MMTLAPGKKQIRCAIAGATGMVGGYALRYMLNLPSVDRVSAIVRPASFLRDDIALTRVTSLVAPMNNRAGAIPFTRQSS